MFVRLATIQNVRIPLVILIATLMFTSYAQDETATPTLTPTPNAPDYLYNWDAQVIYPAAVRFTIYVNRPLMEIQQLTLTIEPEIGNNIVLNVDPADNATDNGTYTEVSYLWIITANDVLPIDSTVEYSWLVSTLRDGTAGVPSAFFYADERATWVEDVDETNHLNFYFPENVVPAETIRDDISPIYDLMSANTGREPSINLALFTNDFPLNPCEEGHITDPRSDDDIPCSDEVIEASISIRGYTPIEIDNRNSNTRAESFIPSLFPQFYSSLERNNNVPAWFVEGFKRFYYPNRNTGDLLALQSDARSGGLIRLEAMGDTDQRLWDAQSIGMVIYIADQIGVEGLFNFANEASSTDDFGALYEDATGLPLSIMVDDLSNWLFLSSTASDFNYTPYLATTATPEPTVSNTPFPPTATNTSTATNTPTATVTVTGFLSATPLPTLTHTATQRAGTSTVTPRPAGSLLEPVATAIPAQVESENNSPDQTQLVAIIAIVGVILLLGLIAVFYRRGK